MFSLNVRCKTKIHIWKLSEDFREFVSNLKLTEFFINRGVLPSFPKAQEPSQERGQKDLKSQMLRRIKGKLFFGHEWTTVLMNLMEAVPAKVRLVHVGGGTLAGNLLTADGCWMMETWFSFRMWPPVGLSCSSGYKCMSSKTIISRLFFSLKKGHKVGKDVESGKS